MVEPLDEKSLVFQRAEAVLRFPNDGTAVKPFRHETGGAVVIEAHAALQQNPCAVDDFGVAVVAEELIKLRGLFVSRPVGQVEIS